MNINHFLKVFQNSTNLLNSSELTKLEIDFSVGIYLDSVFLKLYKKEWGNNCLLYTSDAADERSSVDLGGRRIIKKKKK